MRAADSGFDEYLLWHAWHTEDKGSRYADPTYDLNGKLVREQKGAYGPDLFVGYINDFVERNREWPTTITLAGALPRKVCYRSTIVASQFLLPKEARCRRSARKRGRN